jgi:hypothetical protein
MKKIINKLYAFIGLLGFLTIPGIALADTPLTALSNVAGKAGYAAATNTTLSTMIGLIVQTVLGFLGIVFIVLIIYAGIQWMTAEGDEAKVEKAQTTMRNAIIGLIVTVGAYAVYAVVQRLSQAFAG